MYTMYIKHIRESPCSSSNHLLVDLGLVLTARGSEVLKLNLPMGQKWKVETTWNLETPREDRAKAFLSPGSYLGPSLPKVRDERSKFNIMCVGGHEGNTISRRVGQPGGISPGA